MNSREFRERLARRAKHANVHLRPDLVEPLEAYYRLLARWNAKVNLTAFKLTPAGEDEAIDRLLLEPIIASAHVPVASVTLIDAGSGGGSPAIPLKLALPRLSLRMVEAKTRKAVFLREAVRELGLTDAHVETARFEELLARPELHESADLVSVRAVRIEPRVLITLQAFLKTNGLLLLFRGPGSDITEGLVPPLAWQATFPLIEALRSRLVIVAKTPVGPRR